MIFQYIVHNAILAIENKKGDSRTMKRLSVLSQNTVRFSSHQPRQKGGEVVRAT